MIVEGQLLAKYLTKMTLGLGSDDESRFNSSFAECAPMSESHEQATLHFIHGAFNT